VMGKVPNAILTNSPKLKDVKTVAEFVAYAKAHPGALNSGTQGVGTTSHLTSELFAQMAGVKFRSALWAWRPRNRWTRFRGCRS
jgi:tripartite-type tricarboxylate transporter receptor subunit TctC